MIAGRCHAAVDRGDEAQVARIAQQCDPPRRRQLAQPGHQRRLGRAVLDHDDAAQAGATGISQHRAQAGLGLRQAAIDRDDDIDDQAARQRQGGPLGRQIVGDGERPLRRIAAPAAEPQVIQQRIGRRLRMLRDVVDGIEARVRMAQLRRPCPQVMQQRVEPAGGDVGIVLGIPGAVEERVRITPLRHAMADEVLQRINARRSNVGITQPIPARIKKPGHATSRFGFGCVAWNSRLRQMRFIQHRPGTTSRALTVTLRSPPSVIPGAGLTALTHLGKARLVSGFGADRSSFVMARLVRATAAPIA